MYKVKWTISPFLFLFLIPILYLYPYRCSGLPIRRLALGRDTPASSQAHKATSPGMRDGPASPRDHIDEDVPSHPSFRPTLWSLQLGGSDTSFRLRIQCEDANRANQHCGGRLGLCLAVSPSGPRSSFLGCLAPTPPRVKRKRRHPMCIPKNAAQQATTLITEPPTHPPTGPSARPAGEGEGGNCIIHPHPLLRPSPICRAVVSQRAQIALFPGWR